MTDGTASYDVFDTIVTRTFAHPRDLFVHLGVLLHERGLSKLDPLAFGRARWESELAARRLSPCTEVLLDDIYRVLASRLRWSAAQADEAKSLELVTEERHLRGVPLIRARLATDRARTGRLVFLSDMYLPAATIAPWLQREGAMAPVDLLLVSGEVGGNKSSGDLFRIARQRTGDDFAHGITLETIRSRTARSLGNWGWAPPTSRRSTLPPGSGTCADRAASSPRRGDRCWRGRCGLRG